MLTPLPPQTRYNGMRELHSRRAQHDAASKTHSRDVVASSAIHENHADNSPEQATDGASDADLAVRNARTEHR